MLNETCFSNLKLLAALWINLLSFFQEQIWAVVVVGAVALEMLEMLDLRLVRGRRQLERASGGALHHSEGSTKLVVS